MHRFYGFTVQSDQTVHTNQNEAAAIKMIFAEYLNGLSLGRISEKLQEQGYLSPASKQTWSRSSIDNILTKGYYVPVIVSFEDFTAAQFERQARSNTAEETGKRKATRYHSRNELSGLLLCKACGAPYRRITEHSGEVVWRCANRVEHGKKICKTAPTVSEGAVYQFLHNAGLNADQMRRQIEFIEVDANGSLMACRPAM